MVRPPTESPQNKLSILFEELQKILESDEFDDGLRKYLHESNPDYLRKIEKCKKDLLKEDHGIVVAGETSAGKSTLINKLLQKRIFKGRNKESTSTICKIRNSEDIKIITELLNGETEIIPLQCSIETEIGEKILRDTLKRLTDMTSSKDSKDFRSVDVGFPIPFLKGNTIIVDTPGIGGSGEVSKKVMEYLPYAVSFIFVVDVGSAGGMQNDRLPEILRSIIELQLEDEMPCFDPREVIFITNKWDTIARDGDSDEDSSDEDQEEKTWIELKQDIKNIWPSVKEENIFKMNLKHMNARTVASAKEFENFQHSLKRIIKGNENIRLLHHIRFLDELLKNMAKGINFGLALSKRCVEEQKALTNKHQAKIKDLKRKWKEGERKLLDDIQKIIKNEAHRVLNYMSTDVGKETILNPPEQKSLTEIRYIPILFSKEIRKRIEMYVQGVLH
ncbi:uncharacterized protein in xynA 3'region-like [Saccostrea cucullata]|uniref:uncharacterized protein in xynA 3'region-like n=1 Tax=Saccostrea cuccullata TaxID=36930 RepID=UPI002ED4FA8D